jgi:hypothetical protein
MFKAVITTLLLGTSTVAMADTPYSQPYRDGYGGDRYDDRTRYNGNGVYDERYSPYDDGLDRRDFNRRRILLADNVILGSRAARAAYVPIDARADISRVRLRLQAGVAFVGNVTLVYADGHRETMRIGRVLSDREQAITFDLAHSGVRGILIDSTPMRHARGTSSRRFTTATIDVIGLRR